MNNKTTYFTEAELFSHCSEEERIYCLATYADNMKHTVELANKVREAFGAPLKVNSFYRCKRHNIIAGGSPTSQHLTASAIDLAPIVEGAKQRRLKAVELYNTCKELFRNGKCNFGQVILYDNFVHVSIPQLPPKVRLWNQFFTKRK